jgi:hypothetical protein
VLVDHTPKEKWHTKVVVDMPYVSYGLRIVVQRKVSSNVILIRDSSSTSLNRILGQDMHTVKNNIFSVLNTTPDVVDVNFEQ